MANNLSVSVCLLSLRLETARFDTVGTVARVVLIDRAKKDDQRERQTGGIICPFVLA